MVRKEGTMMSVPGVFATGEVADMRYRQAAVVAGEGCKAAIDTRKWLQERGEAGELGRV